MLAINRSLSTVSRLQEAHREWSSLQKVSFSGTRLDKLAITKLLAPMFTIQLAELNLSRTKLNAAALYVLRAELAYLPSLTRIDLSNDNVG